MKTNKFLSSGGLIRFILFLLLVLSFAQCKGPMGEPGRDGMDGTDGEDGEDGINYTLSAIYDIDSSAWEGGPDGYWITLDVPEITDDIYYNGAVLVYRLIEEEPKSFNMLPYTYVDNGLIAYMDFDAYIGSIDIIFKEVYEGVNDTYAPDGLMTFKVIIIQGIPLKALKKLVDITDMNAVSRLLSRDKVIQTL